LCRHAFDAPALAMTLRQATMILVTIMIVMMVMKEVLSRDTRSHQEPKATANLRRNLPEKNPKIPKDAHGRLLIATLR
jgi:hypothetical protein